MTRSGVAVLRVRREHGTPELLAATVRQLHRRFSRVLLVTGPSSPIDLEALAAATGAEAVRTQGDGATLGNGADELLLADDAWFGPLDDVTEWALPVDGIAALVDHPKSWLLAAGAGVARLVRGEAADRAPLHEWAELDRMAEEAPIVPIEAFRSSALESDARGLVMPLVTGALAARGLDRDEIARDLAPIATPRDLSTNLGLVEVVTGAPAHPPHPSASIVAILHVHYVDMLEELLARVDHLPPSRLIVTTSDAERGREIEEHLRERGREGEVRVAASNRGRDISAFLIGCRDVLDDPATDLVVKLHSKRSPQVGGAAGRSFLALLLDNLLPGPEHAARVLEMFARDERLGIVLAPMVHAAHPTFGRAWFENRPVAIALAARLGISTPLDEASPIAPYGSMFIARAAALRPLVRGDLRWDEFPEEGTYKDGSLAHALERMFVPAALSEGFSFSTVLTPRWAAASHAMLEHKLDAAESSGERWIARKARRVPAKLGELARSAVRRRR